jgi:hypothetical protein
MRHRPFDFGLLGVFLLVSFISGIFGYVLGWDHQCTKDLSGIDRERSTASANCVREEQWRDALTVACGRATR